MPVAGVEVPLIKTLTDSGGSQSMTMPPTSACCCQFMCQSVVPGPWSCALCSRRECLMWQKMA